MAAFNGLSITSKGVSVQSKAQAGSALKFTRIAIGDGQLSGQQIPSLNTLVNQKMNLTLTKLKAQAPNKTVIGATLSNKDITAGFYFREIGVFAQDPDLGEILYAYANAGAGAEFIPANGGADTIEKALDVIVVVGQTANVTAVIDSSLVYVSQTEFQTLVDNLPNMTIDAGKFTDAKVGGFNPGTLRLGVNGVSVRAFDAKGNGVVEDESIAINEAIQYASEHNISYVYIPAGTYNLQNTIFLQQNISLQGDGPQTILRIGDKSDIDAIRTNGLVSNCNLRNFSIDCNKQNNSFINGGSALNGHFDSSVIEFIRVKNCSESAFRLNDDSSIYDSLGYLNMVRNNQIEDANVGVKWGWRCKDSWCMCNNIGADFCDVYIQGGPIRFIGNHFNGSPEYNLYLEGGNTLLFAHNIIENAGKHAIYAPELGFEEAFKNISITDNIIRACSRETNNMYSLIHMEGKTTHLGNGLLVSGNTLVGDNGRFPKYTASLKNVQNVSIHSNILTDGYSGDTPFDFDNVISSSVGGNIPSNEIGTREV
ncbi:glycosyl hydrolase family 28-related protein [Gorillibacterium massiliense]|uniref:glycosyl hydrolase family 28-related protein n=1 Tax=Gorillibacterium massiliense TaxID=1280390 RepID=UPI0004B166FF|nr:glycosyl hydrolase family 28-related protein [Gorillibacterium massiliense]